MITRFEQLLGFLTLTLLGTAILTSTFVTFSTTYYLEVNFSITQPAFGFLCLAAAALPAARVNRSTYVVSLFPYNLYLLANGRFIYIQHLAPTVPAMLLCLWLALNWFVLISFARYTSHRLKMLHHDRQHTAAF